MEWECGVRSVVCVECGGVWSFVECGVWSVVRGVRSVVCVECRVLWSVECCGVWSVECSAWSEE